MSEVLKKDIDDIIDRITDRGISFNNCSFLITGATGLIGSLIIRVLLELNRRENAGISILAITRDEQKAKTCLPDDSAIRFLTKESDLSEYSIDYVIHCAAPTQSKFFVENPVETLDALIVDTRYYLQLSKEKSVKRFLYLSSMEAYGTVDGQKKMNENELGFIDLTSSRSSYSEGKRAAEMYINAFRNEHDLPVVIARLAMCFGAGISRNDNRVHKTFCKSAIEGKDIEVKSSGKTVLNYVYSADAVFALLILLSDEKALEDTTYNVCSDDSGCFTIMDLAKKIANMKEVSVIHDQQPSDNSGFAPDNAMSLDNSRIKGIGWKPKYTIDESLGRLIDYIEETEY